MLSLASSSDLMASSGRSPGLSSKTGSSFLALADLVVVWGSLEEENNAEVAVRVVVGCGGTTEVEVSIHTPKTQSAIKTTVVSVDPYEVDEDDGLLLLRVFPDAIVRTYVHSLYI